MEVALKDIVVLVMQIQCKQYNGGNAVHVKLKDFYCFSEDNWLSSFMNPKITILTEKLEHWSMHHILICHKYLIV